MDIWHRFVDMLDVDVGFHCGGHLHLENTEEGARVLRERVKQLQAWGYPCRMIHSEEIRSLEPGLNSNSITAASLTEIDGQVDPPKVIEACLRRAKEKGATIHDREAVIGLKLGSKGVEAVKTSMKEIECDVVILASGVSTAELAFQAGVQVPQRRSPGVVIRTDPIPRVLRRVSVLDLPAIDKDRPEIHMRQSTDGVLRIGQGVHESLNEDNSQKHADDLLGRAAYYLPSLSGVKAIPMPICYRPMPLDGLPILGFSDQVSNLYIAMMHSGVTLAPIIGELVALEVVEHTRVEMLEPFRVSRFH